MSPLPPNAATGLSPLVPPKSLNQEDIVLLRQLLQKYRGTNWEGMWQYLQTWLVWLVSFTGVVRLEGWASVIPWIVFSGTSMRVFILFHDLCHLSIFRSRQLNLMCAALITPISGRSVQNWLNSHNEHHHTLGDAAAIDFSLTIHFSAAQLAAFPRWKRWVYRFIRDPFILFPLAALWTFWLSAIRDLKNQWHRAIWNYTIYYFFGGAALMRMCLAQWFAATFGVILFHLQHQCNQPYRVPTDLRTRVDAGLWGSTHLLIPWWLRWVTLGIEFHHIHHACTLVPGYRIRACHLEGEKMGLWKRAGVNTVGQKRAFLSLFHALFEETPSKDGVTGCQEPRFVAFEPYKSLGLQDDDTCGSRLLTD